MQKKKACAFFFLHDYTLNYEMLSWDFPQISPNENVIEFFIVARGYGEKLLRVFVEIWGEDPKLAFILGIS